MWISSLGLSFLQYVLQKMAKHLTNIIVQEHLVWKASQRIVKWLVRWVHNSWLDRLDDREYDGNTLKALLREPPFGTCKKDQAGIKAQDYWSRSLDKLN